MPADLDVEEVDLPVDGDELAVRVEEGHVFESMSCPSRRSAIEPPTRENPRVRAQPRSASTDSPPSSGSPPAR